jgi:hypothetical protein
MNDPNAELARLPEGLRKRIESELDVGERITWVGRPGARVSILQSIPLLVFAIPFTLFPAVMIALELGLHIPGVRLGENQSGWFGVPFLLVGLALFYVPVWGRRVAQRTAYVVTDRRGMIFDGVRPDRVYIFLPDQLRNLARTERRNGSGDLIFPQPAAGDSSGKEFPAKLGFEAIPNVRHVEELVRNLVAEHSRDQT